MPNWSGLSNVPSRKTAALSKSSAPLNLQAAAGDSQITLSWQAPANNGGSPITNYRILRSTTPGSETFLTEIGNVLTYTNTGLKNGQIYYYKVRAKNAVGVGALSNEASVTPKSSDLAAFWKFDENTGTAANDSSGNGNTGIINGAAWTTGKLGSALQFDGATNYVEVPKSASIDSATSGITIEAWIKTPLLNRGAIVERWLYDPSAQRAYAATVETDGSVQFLLSSDGSYPLAGTGILTSSGKISPNTWTHIAVTSDGATMKIYINGTQDINTISSPAGGIFLSQANLHIGVWQWSSAEKSTYFNGIIDQVKIYNRSLSAAEINAEYQAGNP